MLLTVAQTAVFQKYAADIWSDDELDQFVNWIAHNPLAGDAIPGTGGLRKVRWGAGGRGKRGGARVIYYWQDAAGKIWLCRIYAKNEAENLPAAEVRKIQRELDR